MTNFDSVKKNDVLVRVMKNRAGERTAWEAVVEEIDEEIIVCRVFVDLPRIMTFNRRTGVNVQGDEFGWLEFKTE